MTNLANKINKELVQRAKDLTGITTTATIIMNLSEEEVKEFNEMDKKSYSYRLFENGTLYIGHKGC